MVSSDFSLYSGNNIVIELEISSQLLGVRSDMLRENFISRRFQSKGRSSAYCVPLDPVKVSVIYEKRTRTSVSNFPCFRRKMVAILCVKLCLRLCLTGL